MYGGSASEDIDDIDKINPAAFFTDDVERNTELIMEQYAKEESYKEYRETGVHRFQLDIPEDTIELKLTAYYTDTSDGKAYTETTAYAAYAPLGMISQKNSLMTIFGQKHKILNFVKKILTFFINDFENFQ